jgi:hypothetical protein
VTSAFASANQEESDSHGLNLQQDVSLFRLFDIDNFSLPTAPAKTLQRPTKKPTSQQKVSPLFDEPCTANPVNFSGHTPASSSSERGFSQIMQQAAATSPPALSGPQEVQIPLRRASARASQRQPKTTTAAALAEDGQQQVRPSD